MPRPKRIRRVENPPHFKGFKPIGIPEENSPVVLNYEEYEAIRLSDFQLLGQVEASKTMGVSRPTYARIYESARRKVAQALVQGKALIFEGGKVYFDSDWYFCNGCECWFNHPEKEQEVKDCPLCGSANIEQYQETFDSASGEDVCICPVCGFEKVHISGSPCRNEICPSCNCPMVRNGSPYHHHRVRNRNCN